ncbi:MAG: hypothetical protein ACREQD_12980, partial [Candidatus Binataceae bacterium]
TLDRFYEAGSPGVINLAGTRTQEHQIKFEARVIEYEALLQSLIALVRLQLPEQEIKGVYEAGDQYGFYRDLSSLVGDDHEGHLHRGCVSRRGSV